MALFLLSFTSFKFGYESLLPSSFDRIGFDFEAFGAFSGLLKSVLRSGVSTVYENIGIIFIAVSSRVALSLPGRFRWRWVRYCVIEVRKRFWVFFNAVFLIFWSVNAVKDFFGGLSFSLLLNVLGSFGMFAIFVGCATQSTYLGLRRLEESGVINRALGSVFNRSILLKGWASCLILACSVLMYGLGCQVMVSEISFGRSIVSLPNGETYHLLKKSGDFYFVFSVGGDDGACIEDVDFIIIPAGRDEVVDIDVGATRDLFLCGF